MRFRRSTAVAMMALATLLTACGDAISPTARPLLPGHLADSLATLTTLLQSQTYLSFRVLGPLSAVPGGGSQIVQAMDIVVDEPDLNETVRIFGTLAVQGSTPSANISVTVNGLPFATIAGQGTLTIRGPNNLPLTEAESALLSVLFALPGRLLDTGRVLARPGQRILGG